MFKLLLQYENEAPGRLTAHVHIHTESSSAGLETSYGLLPKAPPLKYMNKILPLTFILHIGCALLTSEIFSKYPSVPTDLLLTANPFSRDTLTQHSTDCLTGYAAVFYEEKHACFRGSERLPVTH